MILQVHIGGKLRVSAAKALTQVCPERHQEACKPLMGTTLLICQWGVVSYPGTLLPHNVGSQPQTP